MLTYSEDYKDCNPIRGKKSTAWRAEYANGEIILFILAVDFVDRPEEVIVLAKRERPNINFTISQVDVGIFHVLRSVNSYSSDARRLTNNLRCGI